MIDRTFESPSLASGPQPHSSSHRQELTSQSTRPSFRSFFNCVQIPERSAIFSLRPAYFRPVEVERNWPQLAKKPLPPDQKGEDSAGKSGQVSPKYAGPPLSAAAVPGTEHLPGHLAQQGAGARRLPGRPRGPELPARPPAPARQPLGPGAAHAGQPGARVRGGALLPGGGPRVLRERRPDGALLGGLRLQRKRRTRPCGRSRPSGWPHLGHPAHRSGWSGSLLVPALEEAQKPAALSPRGRAHHLPKSSGPAHPPASTSAPRPPHLRAGAGSLWGARRASAPLHQLAEVSLKHLPRRSRGTPSCAPQIHTGFRKPPKASETPRAGMIGGVEDLGRVGGCWGSPSCTRPALTHVCPPACESSAKVFRSHSPQALRAGWGGGESGPSPRKGMRGNSDPGLCELV